MLVKGLTNEKIVSVMSKLNIEGWRTQKGNFYNLQNFRKTVKEYRVASGGDNYTSEFVSPGKYRLINVHSQGYVLERKSPKTTRLGNLDWFFLIIALFETGATQINVLGQRFSDSNEYINYVANANLHADLITETQLRGLDESIVNDYIDG